LFWTWAFANTALVVAYCFAGLARIRASRGLAHRQMMQFAGALVIVFLLSYLVKVGVLGREDRSLWSRFDLITLYIHELCVAVMLLAGGVAVVRARRFGDVRDEAPVAPEASPGDLRLHRIAGRVAIISSVLALLTAGIVLVGMYLRAVS
jgi:uncharacterized membrane protein YozB (DUF420 family)